ncbi:MAG TPA: hypothetical protein VJA19_15830 [Pseudomonas sp.]|nr:hypothetical protein [Pseudomonas sp.]
MGYYRSTYQQPSPQKRKKEKGKRKIKSPPCPHGLDIQARVLLGAHSLIAVTTAFMLGAFDMAIPLFLARHWWVMLIAGALISLLYTC